MKYKVTFSKQAQQKLQKMDLFDRKILFKWIDLNLEGIDDPKRIGKNLNADALESWYYQVGKYRLIAEIQSSTIAIILIQEKCK